MYHLRSYDIVDEYAPVPLGELVAASYSATTASVAIIFRGALPILRLHAAAYDMHSIIFPMGHALLIQPGDSLALTGTDPHLMLYFR